MPPPQMTLEFSLGKHGRRPTRVDRVEDRVVLNIDKHAVGVKGGVCDQG